jgi:hypothetical protein
VKNILIPYFLGMTHDKNSQIEFLLLFIDISYMYMWFRFFFFCLLNICGLDLGLATFHINWKGD